MSKQTRLLVKAILEHADQFEWSIQGFGMLRTYLSKEVRLHIWNPEFEVPNVSTIHDHPWDFESEIVCGAIQNRPYVVLARGEDGKMRDDPELPVRTTYAELPDTHLCAIIRCGTGGGIDKACNAGVPMPRALVPYIVRNYHAGESYMQKSTDVHQTLSEKGTVTLVTRKFKADTEHARVFFPLGTEWVSAEPRLATPEEVRAFVEPALERLMKELAFT